MSSFPLAPLVALTILVSACADTAGGQALTPNGAVVSPVAKPAVTEARPTSFVEWRANFRQKALAQGVTPATFDTAFAGVEVNERVLELDQYQPEFTRPIWEYLDSAVSDTRIRNGREAAAANATRLAQIESRYGVDRNVVVAIWGLESAYGANMGSMSVVESMATLAYEGRRRQFAEDQLIAALKIIQNGDVAPSRMVGSWAGAMGHTQFIPTSYADYAVDFTGDGRRDVWAVDPSDALASTANYLGKFGWTKGQPAVVEVTLPAGFNYALADPGIRKPVSEWRAMGVATGTAPEVEASILLPAGANGPAFLELPNFRVIKRYNNATSYALAVSHLADRIGGAGPFVASWPRSDRALSRSEKEELQRRLTALGFDTQGADGIIGPNSRAAVRAFQQANGITPDGYVSGRLLDLVRAAG
ncbi:lytic murein transglycosylase [Rhodobacteraceae bacterium NNCM2]|nr:lytic murein transglycosylase [Coraliihabitans acroporae]